VRSDQLETRLYLRGNHLVPVRKVSSEQGPLFCDESAFLLESFTELGAVKPTEGFLGTARRRQPSVLVSLEPELPEMAPQRSLEASLVRQYWDDHRLAASRWFLRFQDRDLSRTPNQKIVIESDWSREYPPL
jgi:hypothetical protein